MMKDRLARTQNNDFVYVCVWGGGILAVVKCILSRAGCARFSSLPMVAGLCHFVLCLFAWRYHTGKCIRRFGGIYAYCRYFIDRKW